FAASRTDQVGRLSRNNNAGTHGGGDRYPEESSSTSFGFRAEEEVHGTGGLTMKTVLSLVAATGLLIGSAAGGSAQQGAAPGGMTGGSSGSVAQFGSSPGSAASPNGSTPGEPAVSGNASGGG